MDHTSTAWKVTQNAEPGQSLIWPSKWTLSKALFLANRYLPFWFVTIFLYFGMIIAALCADAVLYLRLYALSKQGSWFGIVCVVGIGLFLPSETFVPSPNLLPQTPCFHWGNKATTIWLTVCYGALLYSSLLPSIKIFHRDGAIYFVCIATISLVNAFIARVAPVCYNTDTILSTYVFYYNRDTSRF
ncbi:hypothetical protein BKA70DRAFT_1328617 [Coprinopsis sp. MPI-PUGE-AT-0042]|nr:hypothetical protein BKA70DRAFT_1328617 [Coprinopsis sp. MPI-PUGE-AT-0042]